MVILNLRHRFSITFPDLADKLPHQWNQPPVPLFYHHRRRVGSYRFTYNDERDEGNGNIIIRAGIRFPALFFLILHLI